jgi:hypothetical protein
MSSDRSRRHGPSKMARDEHAETSIDRHAGEALRALVRVLAREAARELFAKSCERIASEQSREGRP